MGDDAIGEVGSLKDLFGYDKVRPARGKPGRRCECCGAALRSDNRDKLCSPCDEAIIKWQLFPHLRREMELFDHCKNYLESRGAKRR